MIWTIAIYGLLPLLALVVIKMHSSAVNREKSNTPKAITFLIPFRNEATRIQDLIQSLNHANWQSNFEVIFVDDHSEDKTADILLADLDIPFKILRLRKTTGKKAAIVHGVSNANHEYIHTLDADTAFPPDFLTNVSRLPAADLTILPVELSGNGLLQQLNQIEFQWMQSFTFALAKQGKPVLCNGANLFFSKKAFLETLPLRTDFDKVSGDDIYLLQAIRRRKGNIKANSSSDYAIKTPAPASFKILINQRRRWIKKMFNVPTVLFITVYVLYHAMPLLCLYFAFDNVIWLLPASLKIVAEWILSREYSVKQLGLLIVHQVYYPIYGALLVGALPFGGRWR